MKKIHSYKQLLGIRRKDNKAVFLYKHKKNDSAFFGTAAGYQGWGLWIYWNAEDATVHSVDYASNVVDNYGKLLTLFDVCYLETEEDKNKAKLMLNV